MDKFDEIARDIVFSISEIHYDDMNKEILKLDLQLFLRTLTKNYNSYTKSINYLCKTNDDTMDEVENNKNFECVVLDFYNQVNNIKYDDVEKEILKSNVLININKITKSYDNYRRVFSLLSQRAEEKIKTKRLNKCYELLNNNG